MTSTPYALVIEDDPWQAALIEDVLARLWGDQRHRVHLRTGEDALAHLSSCVHDSSALPRLVVLDLGLPGLDGIEILDWMRSVPELRSIPVAVLTGSVDPDERSRAMEAGADLLLDKPRRFSELVESLRQLEELAA